MRMPFSSIKFAQEFVYLCKSVSSLLFLFISKQDIPRREFVQYSVVLFFQFGFAKHNIYSLK